MGKWLVVVEGIGTHDNEVPHTIEAQVAHFVKCAKDSGQHVTRVTVVPLGTAHHEQQQQYQEASGRFGPPQVRPPGLSPLGPLITSWPDPSSPEPHGNS